MGLSFYQICPGCRSFKSEDDVACQMCWDRLPTKLPIGEGGAQVAWKRSRVHARQLRAWGRVEEINDAIQKWLDENPADGQEGR